MRLICFYKERMFKMMMSVMLKKDEIKEVKEMLFSGYDQIQELIKNLSPEKTDKILDIISEQKSFMSIYLDDVEMINISMEKKIDALK